MKSFDWYVEQYNMVSKSRRRAVYRFTRESWNSLMRHRSWEIERAVTEALKKPKLELLKDWRFRPILCEDCSTRGILGGAAMTNWTCHVCKVSQMHGSTATPNICTACAIRLFKCQRCEESLEKDLHESGE